MDIFSLTPVSLCKAVHNSDIKRGSLSMMICLISPFSQYHSSKSTTAISLAVALECIGASRTSAPRRSVMVRIVSFPSSLGRGPTKSNATASNRASGTGRGCRGPVGLVVQLLLHWQGEHDGMYTCVRKEVLPYAEITSKPLFLCRN